MVKNSIRSCVKQIYHSKTLLLLTGFNAPGGGVAQVHGRVSDHAHTCIGDPLRCESHRALQQEQTHLRDTRGHISAPQSTVNSLPFTWRRIYSISALTDRLSIICDATFVFMCDQLVKECLRWRSLSFLMFNMKFELLLFQIEQV